MNLITITNTTSHIPTGQPFVITTTEPACTNCSWHINIPNSIILINREHLTTSQPYSTKWIFNCTNPGTYTLQFLYRKQCCGKPTLKQEDFTITIF